MQAKRWDIFCKIVDNFGDIGVCWRLAKQLQNEHGLQIRLFIDDLDTAKYIVTEIDETKAIQACEDVTIAHWHQAVNVSDIADVVIETFACGLPAQYQNDMCADTVWVNVEHLSAEAWVADFHTQFSKVKDSNLTRHFYFPGFSEATGGLLHEQGLIAKRNAALSATIANGELKVSMFCYANAPLKTLLSAIAGGDRHVTLLVPFESHLQSVASFFDRDALHIGDKAHQGELTLVVLPFLTQDDYDQLLWTCDINFVRGEDSWMRAIWAGKPFIWQPYLQSENTHLTKLDAFLALFYAADANVNQSIGELHHAWSTDQFSVAIWQRYLSHLSEISTHTFQQSNALAKQSSLADRLVAFCDERIN